jgi:hypothetical protein
VQTLTSIDTFEFLTKPNAITVPFTHAILCQTSEAFISDINLVKSISKSSVTGHGSQVVLIKASIPYFTGKKNIQVSVKESEIEKIDNLE